MRGRPITIIVVIVLLAAAVTAGVITQSRRRRLQHRFGAEYERLVQDRQSRRQAEAELVMRERHVGDLGIRPLTPTAVSRYAAEWTALQERFVDMPADAVADAQRLVVAVLTECGYPTTHREQVISDLSVDHASTLDHFRAACDISERTAAGNASTEDMRQALIHYRSLFIELLGLPAERNSEPAAASSAVPRPGSAQS